MENLRRWPRIATPLHPRTVVGERQKKTGRIVVRDQSFPSSSHKVRKESQIADYAKVAITGKDLKSAVFVSHSDQNTSQPIGFLKGGKLGKKRREASGGVVAASGRRKRHKR